MTRSRRASSTIIAALLLAALSVPSPLHADQPDAPSAHEAHPGERAGSLSEFTRCLRDFLSPCPIGEVEAKARPRGRSLTTLVLLSGATAGIYFGAPQARTPNWQGGIAADDSIRRGLVAGRRSTRDAAEISSDVLLGLLAVGLASDWIWSDDYGTGESVTTDLSWILGGQLGVLATKVLVDRERPYADECLLDPRYSADCGTRDENVGFFSGHASISATFAGLLCARHLAREDRRPKDWGICGTAAATSATTGILRIVADKHYASDVAVGWAVGAAFGYVLPRAFDYRGEEGAFSRISLSPVVGTERWGLAAKFEF